MTSKRVLLAGFYGYANFGDDVLMQVTYALMRHALPDAKLTVMTDAFGAAYVPAMLPQIACVPVTRDAYFDLIIHGGGGVFFDFAHYGIGRRVVEKIMMIGGLEAYLQFERLARRLLRRPRITTARRLGLGIGVGGFSAGSPYLRNRLHMLAEFDALWLRDAQSEAQLKPFARVMHDARIAGSDLAFLTEYWLPEALPARIPSSRPRLGVALRDWPEMSREMLEQTIAALAVEYDVSGFILDARHDPLMTELLAPYPTHIWQPTQMCIADFTAQMAKMDVLLTSRAHAAICGACVGVPSVIVAIEPKMAQVHAMLPNATRLVAMHEPQQWAQALAQMAALSPTMIEADVERNRSSSRAALATLERWFA